MEKENLTSKDIFWAKHNPHTASRKEYLKDLLSSRLLDIMDYLQDNAESNMACSIQQALNIIYAQKHT
jgi:hypothetical protein